MFTYIHTWCPGLFDSKNHTNLPLLLIPPLSLTKHDCKERKRGWERVNDFPPLWCKTSEHAEILVLARVKDRPSSPPTYQKWKSELLIEYFDFESSKDFYPLPPPRPNENEKVNFSWRTQRLWIRVQILPISFFSSSCFMLCLPVPFQKSLKIKANGSEREVSSRGSRIFQRGPGQRWACQPIIWRNVCQKLLENKRFWTERGPL